jgi:hypothetical protein
VDIPEPRKRLQSPAQQIAQVRSSLADLEARPASPERDQALRDAGYYLEQLLSLDARGDLAPLDDDAAIPFLSTGIAGPSWSRRSDGGRDV